ncbi:MAG: hypothetical protein ABIF18_02095 [archaeon]
MVKELEKEVGEEEIKSNQRDGEYFPDPNFCQCINNDAPRLNPLMSLTYYKVFV